jgi:hypothetical protein
MNKQQQQQQQQQASESLNVYLGGQKVLTQLSNMLLKKL